jgi:chromosome partitioning protein
LGLFNDQFIYAADELYSIASAILAMQGLAKLVEVVEKIKKPIKTGLKVGGVLLPIRW